MRCFLIVLEVGSLTTEPIFFGPSTHSKTRIFKWMWCIICHPCVNTKMFLRITLKDLPLQHDEINEGLCLV